MSLVLSGGLLLAPALASRLDQPAPSAVLAGGSATGDLATSVQPVVDVVDESSGEAAPEDEGLTLRQPTADGENARATTTTTHVHRAPKVAKVARVAKAAKVAKAAVPANRPTPANPPKAGPPLKPVKPAKPAPKPVAQPVAKPAPKPAPAPAGNSAPKPQATTPVERNPWADSPPKNESETLACIRWVETRGDYRAVSPSGQYRGAYQMDDNFWRYYGGDEELTGRHEKAPPAEQDAVATRGLRDRGLEPWPSAVEECA